MSNLAETILRDVRRHTIRLYVDDLPCLLEKDVLAALTAALDPALSERAERLARSDDPKVMLYHGEYVEALRSLIAQNAALRAERDALVNEAVLSKAAYEGVSSLLLSVQQDCIKERQRAEAAEAQNAALAPTDATEKGGDAFEDRDSDRPNPATSPGVTAGAEAAHVNETPKSEHDAGNVLTDAAQAPAEDAHVKGETAGQMLERLGMDGAKWAAEFRTTALRLGYSDMDEGWLIGWFCNAIMAGYDRSAAQAREAALMEAHKAILAMDTKKDEDLTYNLAVLRAAEKVRRLIDEART